MTGAKAIIGRDDWLFLDQDANRVQMQITGNFPLPEDFEKTWEDLGTYRQTEFAKRRIPYSYFIAPNKECVYSEYLPEGTVLSPQRPVSKVIPALSNKFNVSYPINDLRDHRRIRETYSKGDTHWNQYGSFIAYRVMMQSIGIEPMSEADLSFFSQPMDGDLSSKIGTTNEYIFAKILNDRAKLVYNNHVKNVGNLFAWEHQDQSLPKLVLFRDSFSTSLLAMVAQHFSRLVVVWQPNIDYGLIDRERPDFVISQQAERFLTSVPDDINGLTNEQHAARKA